jgi:glycerol-3-phosphate acyltransferase
VFSLWKHYVFIANQSIMVEAFLKDFLGANLILWIELSTYEGRVKRFVDSLGELVGKNNGVP